MKDLLRILENPFFVDGLEAEETYSRIHDDTDGTGEGAINIKISQDGDVWVQLQATHNGAPLRFRQPFFGGGQSPRTKQALLFLALAIKLDNEDCPQSFPNQDADSDKE
jgi:hypothetical protein